MNKITLSKILNSVSGIADNFIIKENFIILGCFEKKVFIKDKLLFFEILDELLDQNYRLYSFYGNFDLSGINVSCIENLPDYIYGDLDLSDNELETVGFWPFYVAGNVNLGFNKLTNESTKNFIKEIGGTDIVLNHNQIKNFKFLENINCFHLRNLNLMFNNILYLPDFNKKVLSDVQSKYDNGIKLDIDSLNDIENNTYNVDILSAVNNPFCFINMRELDLNEIKDWVCKLEGITCHSIKINNKNIDYVYLRYKKKWISKDIIRALFDFYNLKSMNISKIKNCIDINNKVILAHNQYFYLTNSMNILCYNENAREKIL